MPRHHQLSQEADIIPALQRRHWPLLKFLTMPVLIVGSFVVLAEAVDWVDNRSGPPAGWGPFRLWLSQYVGDTQSAIGVLSAIAGSLFTITSITFSILLLAVQQGAAVLNSQVVDHYLRRGSNQAWFGFFVGVSLFVLITLVQTTHTSAPVFGVMISTLLGAVALIALVVLIYSTIDQTRPITVVNSIMQAAMEARARQLPLLAASRPAGGDPARLLPGGVPLRSRTSGYLLRIDLDVLQAALAADPGAEVVLQRSVGAFVLAGSPLAIVRGASDTDAMERAIISALPIVDQREVVDDPGYSLHHVGTIGWTAISTARSDPAVGAIAIHAVEQLLQAWAAPPPRGAAGARLVFEDRLPDQVVDTVESFLVASAESRQHQTAALILSVLASSLPTLPPNLLRATERLLFVAASLMPELTPTRVLHDSVVQVAATCRSLGLAAVAADLEATLTALPAPA